MASAKDTRSSDTSTTEGNTEMHDNVSNTSCLLVNNNNNSGTTVHQDSLVNGKVDDEFPSVSTDTNKEYEFINLYGNKCIVWKWKKQDLAGKEAKVEGKRRKAVKDELAKTHIGIPMLDRRNSANGLIFCDIVIYIQDVNTWYSAICQHYAKTQVYNKTIRGGQQLLVMQRGNLMLSFNFYHKKNIILIQPGDHQEGNLMNFMKQLQDLKKNLCALHDDDADEEEDDSNKDEEENDQTEKEVLTKPNMAQALIQDDEDAESRELSQAVLLNESIPIQTENKTYTDQTRNAVMNKEAHIAACNLHVKLPPLTQRLLTSVDEPSIPNKESAQKKIKHFSENTEVCQCDNKCQNAADAATQTDQAHGMNTRVVINEVLCFLQNWMNIHNHETIVKLCTDFYDHETLAKAKDVLYENAITNSRKKKRIGADKAKHEVLDMLKILLEQDVPHQVTYAAAKIADIPPLDRHTFDIMHVFREIDQMKQVIKQLCSSQLDVTKLVKDKLQAEEISSHESRLPADKNPASPIIRAKTSTKEQLATKHQNNKVHAENCVPKRHELAHHLVECTPTAGPSKLTPVFPELKEHAGNCTPAQHESSNCSDDCATIQLEPKAAENVIAILHESVVSGKEHYLHHHGNSSIIHEGSSQNMPVSPCPSSFSNYEVIDSASITDESDTSTNGEEESDTSKDKDDDSWAIVLGKHRESRKHGTYQNSPSIGQRKPQQHLTKQRNKYSTDVIVGEASPLTLEAVTIPRGNKQCTGVFVTCLKPKTSAAQVAVHIHREFSLTVRPEKLPPKNEHYSSFYIRCNRMKRQQLLNKQLWPRGAVVKPYYSN